MRLLVYEHLTACNDASLPASLRSEGAAMRDAVRADFAACPGVEVVASSDDAYDAALVIAPEMGGVLTEVVRQIERRGRIRLLSPSSTFCSWASDKSRVAETLSGAGVSMPRGLLLQSSQAVPHDFPLPAVLKPNDGCGSQGIFVIRPGCNDEHSATAGLEGPRRVEEYVPGLAVSVAVLRGPAGVFPLPACWQRIADDGTCAYLGGSCPLDAALNERAERMARHAAAAMPEGSGYIGFDLVLGPSADGSRDFLIEVNPRLTMSYVGLRARSETNLAAAMLDVVFGRVPRLAFRNRGVSFDSCGAVRYV